MSVLFLAFTANNMYVLNSFTKQAIFNSLNSDKSFLGKVFDTKDGNVSFSDNKFHETHSKDLNKVLIVENMEVGNSKFTRCMYLCVSIYVNRGTKLIHFFRKCDDDRVCSQKT